MNPSKILLQICDDLGVTVAELSRRSGQAPQNLGRKLNQETLKMEEFLELIDSLGVKFNYSLKLPTSESPDFQFEDDKSRDITSNLENQIVQYNEKIEYLTELGRKNLTAFYTVTGNTDLALKHIDDADRVEKCLKKIQIANKQITSILREMLNVQEAGLISDTGKAPGNVINRGQRVLLVSDNDLDRGSTKAILEESGLVVEEAYEGEIALNMISSSKPRFYSVVLMDIRGSGFNGFESARKIRKLPNRLQAYVPMVAITSGSDKKGAKKATDAGFDACVAVPVDAEKLNAVISQVI